MKISAKQITDRGLSLTEEIPPETVGLAPADLRFCDSLRVSVALQKLGDGCYVKGEVRARIERECHRCLEGFEEPLRARFEVLCQRSGTAAPKLEREIRQGDVGIMFFSGDDIDLSEEIRSAVVTSIPMKCLCRSDCKGLCPGCGANLNVDRCRCAGEPEGEGPLADLLDRLDLGGKTG